MATRSVSSSRFLVRDFVSCIKFNSGTDVISTSSNPSITLTGSYSISFWTNVSVFSTSAPRFLAKAEAGVKGEYDIYQGSDRSIKVVHTDGVGDATSTSIAGLIDYGKWIFITITFDQTNIRFYKNGVLFGTAVSQTRLPTDSGKTLIFGNTSASNRGMSGRMDEIMIFKDRVLSVEEIINLYLTGKITTSNLGGYWKFDEGSGSSATDSSSNGNTGTITGATYSTDVFLKPRSAATNRLRINGVLPTSISGLVGWWKADSLVLNDGDVVDSWTDSSGNGNHLTGTTTQRPTFKTNLINSTYPLVRFNGTSNVLTKTGIVTANPFTIFAVGQAQNTISQNGRMVAGNVGNWLMGIRQSLFRVFNNNFADSTIVPTVNTPYLHIVTQAANDCNQYLTFGNNANILNGKQTGSNVAPNGIKFGGGAGEFMQVDIVEVIIFSSVLSMNNINNVSYYLGKKYNLVPINLSRSAT